LIKVQKIGIGE